MKIFYSIEDNFPPFRVDIVELFFRELHERGLDLVWYMRRGQAGPCAKDAHEGQPVHLPWQPARGGALGKLATRLAFWGTGAWQLCRHAWFTPRHIQVRDQYIGALVGLLAARLGGKKFFYWCSYPFPEFYLERAARQRGIRRWYSAFMGRMGELVLYRLVMPRADHNFVQSDRMKADIAARGVPPGRMTPVPMGVPRRLVDQAPAERPPVDRDLIVYIGSLGAVRRMEDMIDGFALLHARVPRARLVLVGDGDLPGERPELEARVARLGLQEAVRFTGFVPMEQAWRIAAGAAVCVSPIYPTRVLIPGSPTKLIEYMAMGRPVVCNDHPEQKLIIEQSGAGLCTPWLPSAFADAIEWMLEHPDEAEAMGRKGPAWVAAHRTYDVLAEQVLQVYRRVGGEA